MTFVTALPRRAWRRLAKIESLTLPMAKAKERIEALHFQLDSRQRARLDEDYARCRTIAEYFAFSNRVFGPHQLEPEITNLLELAAKEEPRAVCEIGTANGGTTFLLGQALPTTDVLIGVDLFVRRRPQLVHFKRPGQTVVLIDGDSGCAETLDQVRRALGGRQLDLLFIDGDHTFSGVASDFRLYRELVSAGGLIAFHDIVEDQFTRTGLRTEHWTGDVPRFWQMLKKHYVTHEIVAAPDQDGLGIGVIHYEPSVELPQFTAHG
jgi:predicted O-methyltransferase YrrM